MPQAQLVRPDQVRERGLLEITPIPVNVYDATPQSELRRYGAKRLSRVLYDMLTIREFESMLNSIKMTGAYQGIEYSHPGPAHLSIGQEASAVGLCLNLDSDDLMFGSHRSHGEILAKCFSAMAKLDEPTLQRVMEAHLGGETLAAVESLPVSDVLERAELFVLYGTLAEIFARRAGFNRGLGGSMHAFFAPFGSMPNNAIVGGSADIALGAALFKRINRKAGVVIANIGDASVGCGPVWEAMALSAMDQYRSLWDTEVGGAPPVMFNFMNNFYGMGGQTVGETMGFRILARSGAGINPQNMHAERVDGYNPLAVADALERKKKIMLAGEGPVLMDTVTYRLSGHSPSDASSYRTKEEIALWEGADSLTSYAARLAEAGVMTAAGVDEMRAAVATRMRAVCAIAVDLQRSPRVAPAVIEQLMFSNGNRGRMEEGAPEVLLPRGEDPRSAQIAKKSRAARDESGAPLPRLRVVSYRDALFEAVLHRFYEDPTMAAWGEENRDWGGAFGVYRGLTEALPYHRLFNSSISEGAIVGSGVGYALSGGRALVELMYCDFMGRAGDEIFNQASKWQAMSAGTLTMPLVVRVSVGSKYGAQHSQDWTSLVAHIPGLKVMFPATPYDAKGMLNLALRGTDPVIFFESQRLYDIGEEFHPGGVPAGYYEVPEGEPAVRREGSDLTIVTIGATLYVAMAAAAELDRYGVSAEVIDARFINPLRLGPIAASVAKTGKLLLASDACERGSFLYTLAGAVARVAFDDLDAPPVVVGSRNWITPAVEMEESFFPQKEWIVDAVHQNIVPLPDHTVTTAQDPEEMRRRYASGV